MKKSAGVLGSAIAAIGLMAAAGGALAQSLAEAYAAARAFDAQFASAQRTLEATRERIPQGRAGILPSANVTGNLTRNYLDNNAPNRVFTSAQFTQQAWQLVLSQPLYRPANWTVVQQAELQVLQAEANFAQSSQDLVLRVVQAYFDVLAAEDALRFIGAQKTAIAEQLAQARRNFEVGTATITDTNEAQARFDLAVASEIAGQNDVEVRRRALAQITGREFRDLWPLRSKLSIPPPEPNRMDDWVKQALDSAFTVRAAEAGWEIARREVDRQRAGHLPTLDLVGSTGRSIGANAVTGARTDLNTTALGLQLAVPLFAGGAVDSRVREAVALRERARSDLDNVRRTAEFSTRQSFLNYTNGLAQVRALEQALTSSEVALASNRLGYDVGVRINIDVLNAQQQVFQTRRDLSRARYDAILNGLRLKSFSGTLTEADIAAVSQLLGRE